jgi:DNA-binding LytR/AlgR family response regulator
MILKILVIEDEVPAQRKILRAISSQAPDAQVDCIATVEDGVDYLRTQDEPDLIFSDVELLDGRSFEIFEKVEIGCPIVFITAYDQYSLEAFRSNGIEYLVKPFDKDSFERAWNKYQKLFLHRTKSTSLRKKTINLIAKKGRASYLLSLDRIVIFQAGKDFVVAIDTEAKKHIISKRLKEIEELIDPKAFYKINRSEIVARKAIKAIRPYIKDRIELELSSGLPTLHTSNSRSAGFKSWWSQD